MKNQKETRANNKDKSEKGDKSTIQQVEMQFLQTSGREICYCCGKQGHLSPDCPEKAKQKRVNGLCTKLLVHTKFKTMNMRKYKLFQMMLTALMQRGGSLTQFLTREV